MRELTSDPSGSKRWKESQIGQTSSTAISRLSERLNDQGWLRDATVDDLQPLVDFAWRDVTAAAGSQIARKAVSIVMQAYRTPDLTNPAAFVDMAVGALEDMPSIVLAELASPKIGIVRESKFPPTIAEMVQWCEERLKKHRLIAETGSLQIERRRRAQEVADHRMKEAAEKQKATEEWLASEPERQRKAKEAQLAIAAASAKKAIEEAAKRKEQDARAAWMKRIFSEFVEDAVVTERLCSLTEAEQDEATRRELEMPGAGSQWLAEKIRS